MVAALVHGSTIAAASNEMISANIRTSQLPCNFCFSKASHGHCRIVASSAFHRKPVCNILPFPKQKPLINQTDVDSYRKSSSSEHWIEDSICDIVKHINEAPYLQLLFDSKDSSMTISPQRRRVPTGNSLSADEKWKEMKSHISRASPDGVILVHHLQGCDSIGSCVVADDLGMDTAQSDANDNVIGKSSNGKDLWGILVLGRAIAKSACYILETTNVASPFGTCTSFCLTKAQSFGPSWHDQIQSSWLLNTDI